MNISFYYLPITPPPSEFCGLDELGSLYFHPGAISDALRKKAEWTRAAIYVRIPEGIVPLVSFDWAEQNIDDQEQLDLLDILKGSCRGFIQAGAQPHNYPLANVSLPGDPAFSNALLRLLADLKN